MKSLAYYRNITLIHSGSEGRAENGEKSGNVRPQNDVTHTKYIRKYRKMEYKIKTRMRKQHES